MLPSTHQYLDSTLLPHVTHLETTGEFVAELRKSISGEVVRLSDTSIKSERFIAFILSLRNNWTNRIVSGVSLDDLLEYLDTIREYIPLLPEAEKLKIMKSIDTYQNKDFWYDAIVQMGIAPESIISSLLQYSKLQLWENVQELDNSTFVAYVLACDMAVRFTDKLKRSWDKNTLRESKEQLAEAFNALNIYWYSPLVQKTIESIEPKTTRTDLILQYSCLKNILDSFASFWEKSGHNPETSIRKGMEQYIKLISYIKDYMPHPSVLTGPASEWTLG